MVLLSIKIVDDDQIKKQHVALLKALTAYMKDEYPSYTTSELLLAYRLGVKCKLPGKDGEPLDMFPELNPRQVGRVLHAYEQFKREELSKCPAPKKAIAGLLPEYVPSQSEQDKSNAQLFGFAYKAAENKRQYDDLGNLIYNWLDSKGLIPFNKDRKWEFMHQAQEAVRKEEIGFGVTGNMQQHKDARNMAELIKQAQELQRVHEPIKDRIATKAKQIAFNTLLRDLIEIGTTPDEFLSPLTDSADGKED